MKTNIILTLGAAFALSLGMESQTMRDTVLDEVIIVGSRFMARSAMNSPVPVDNLQAKDLQKTGQISLDKMMHYSLPSFNSTQQTISDATAHFDPADLRGLGPSRTLVLVNGKRKNASSLVYINDTPGKGEVGVDMKSIPVSAIARIEVLRDGAAAQYGSDAIAGVINIILKDDVDEGSLNLYSGITSAGDGLVTGYSVTSGTKVGDDGRLSVTISYEDQNETNRAGSPGKDNLFGVDNAWTAANPTLGMRVGMPNMTTSSVFYNFSQDLGSGAEFYSFGGTVYRRGISYALYRTPYWITNDFGFYNGEGFQPTFQADINDVTFANGVKGKMGDWMYDISNTIGSNSVDYTVKNSLNLAMGAQSPTTFYPGGYAFKTNITNMDFARRLNNKTFLSVGTEFRTENFQALAGGVPSYWGNGAQSFPGIQPQNAVNATRYNAGMYAGLDYDVNEDLLIGATVRSESYSDFGDNFSWKVNGRYKMMDEKVALRASYSTGFRAPSLHQIHLSNIQTLVSGGTISNQGTFNNESSVVRQLGVEALRPELATNISVGMTAKMGSNFTISVDAYDVSVNDRIVYSSSIASSDSTTQVGQILQANAITSLKFFVNAIDTRTQGIDIVSSYRGIGIGSGSLDVNFAANMNQTEIVGDIATPAAIAAAGVDLFDRKEQGRILSSRPQSKFIFSADYHMGDMDLTLGSTRFGSVTWMHGSDPAKDQTFAAKFVTDLSIGYQLSESSRLNMSINNLLDVYPDPINTMGDPVTDLGGRFLYPWEVNQFGFMGRMYLLSLNYQF